MNFPARPMVRIELLPALRDALHVDSMDLFTDPVNYVVRLASADAVRTIAPDLGAIARLDRAGVIVTGTVHAGAIRVDDRLLLTPSGLEARVRSLHAQNRAAEVGRAGERCALNLTGPRLSKDAIRRGDWVVSPELHAPTDRPDVRLHLLASEGQPLKHWSPVHVHLGSAHVMGRVALLEGDQLAPGDTALAQLVLEDKIGALAGDRVILRNPSATRTMAGAVVIDPFGPPRNRRSERRLAELDALGAADADVLPKLLRLESGFVETGRFGQARNLRPVDVDRLLQMAGGAKLEGFGFLAETLAAARKDIVETLAAHHQAKPDAPGLQPVGEDLGDGDDGVGRLRPGRAEFRALPDRRVETRLGLRVLEDLTDHGRGAGRLDVGVGGRHRRAQEQRLAVPRADALPHVVRARVQRGGGAEGPREREAPLRQVHRDHVRDPTVHERGDRGEADRPGAEHHRLLAGARLAALRRVHADAERLGQRRHLERHAVGNREDVLAQAGVPHQQARREAALGAAVADAVACGTRVHDHARAAAQACHLAADALDHAGQLVAERKRPPRRARDAAEPDVADVAPADAARRDAHHDVARARLGLRHLVEAHVVGAVEAHLLHFASPTPLSDQS
jgi:hypothetical protein